MMLAQLRSIARPADNSLLNPIPNRPHILDAGSWILDAGVGTRSNISADCRTGAEPLLPALAGIKPGLTIKVEHRDILRQSPAPH